MLILAIAAGFAAMALIRWLIERDRKRFEKQLGYPNWQAAARDAAAISKPVRPQPEAWVKPYMPTLPPDVQYTGRIGEGGTGQYVLHIGTHGGQVMFQIVNKESGKLTWIKLTPDSARSAIGRIHSSLYEIAAMEEDK